LTTAVQQVSLEDAVHEGLQGLPSRFLIMVASSPTNYVPVLEAVVRNLMTEDTIGIYISVNKPYFSLTEEMELRKIPTKNMYFIDCASGLMGKPPQESEQTYILSGPSNLTELSITIAKVLKSDRIQNNEPNTILFLDSVSTFLIYNDPNTVARFLHSIAGKVRATNIRGVFFSLQDDLTKGAIESTTQFHDKVLSL
jgi:hypothetical protein